MTTPSEVQQLDPGPILELWELDATPIGGGRLRFQGQQDGVIWWQGQDYAGWSCKGEGFEITSEQQPTPRFRVGNTNRAITILCRQFDDLVGARILRRRTFAKFLDAVNFPEGNPEADPTKEFPVEVWFIERRSAESPAMVEFELSSVLNFQGVKLPRRQIIANQCPFKYRGPLCNYTGPAVADELDQPTSDPMLDRCGKRLSSCEMRQWPDDVLNFGGFPAADLVRT